MDPTWLANVSIADFDGDETADSVFGHDPARYLLRADSVYAEALWTILQPLVGHFPHSTIEALIHLQYTLQLYFFVKILKMVCWICSSWTTRQSRSRVIWTRIIRPCRVKTYRKHSRKRSTSLYLKSKFVQGPDPFICICVWIYVSVNHLQTLVFCLLHHILDHFFQEDQHDVPSFYVLKSGVRHVPTVQGVHHVPS